MKPLDLDYSALPIHSTAAYNRRILVEETATILAASTLFFIFLPLKAASYASIACFLIIGYVASLRVEKMKKAFDAQVASFQNKNDLLLFGAFVEDYLPIALKNLSPNIRCSKKHISTIHLPPSLDVIIIDVPYYIELPKGRTDHFCSTAVIPTKSEFPHLYLESKSRILESYCSSPKLELEGNFNEFFTVYVPEKLNLDALTVLTPDVMQTLIQYCSNYDMEFYGNSVYFIQKKTPYTQADLPTFLQAMLAVSKELNEMARLPMDKAALTALQTPALIQRQPFFRRLYDSEGISGLIGIVLSVLMVLAALGGAILHGVLNRH